MLHNGGASTSNFSPGRALYRPRMPGRIALKRHPFPPSESGRILRGMSWLETFGDRLALVLWALAADVVLAWLVFHPAAAAVLQLTLVLFVAIRRFTLHHAESIAHA